MASRKNGPPHRREKNDEVAIEDVSRLRAQEMKSDGGNVTGPGETSVHHQEEETFVSEDVREGNEPIRTSR